MKEELLSIINAVKITSSNSFSFAGKNFSYVPGSLYYVNSLIDLLKQILYTQCYCQKFGTKYVEIEQSGISDKSFLTALVSANTSVSNWDSNWVIEQKLANGRFVAKKNSHYKILNHSEFKLVNIQKVIPKEGDVISIDCKRDSSVYQSAFYYAFGNEVECDQNLVTLVRVYFNIESHNAPQLLKLISSELNKYFIPFTFKCLNQSTYYSRIDSAVLYIQKPYYNITKHVLTNAFEEQSFNFNDATSLFTKKIMKGVSVAEEPGDGESFGTSRCGMLANSLINSKNKGIESPEEILDDAEFFFQNCGINIYNAYLNKGSTDTY